jgi:hypothetical protein
MTTNTLKSTNARTAPARAPARKATATPKGRKSTTPRGRVPAERSRRATARPTQQRVSTSAGGRPEWGFPVAHVALAAERAVQRNSIHVELPVIGVVHLPPKEELAFIGGITAMAAVGLLEWPVAVLLGIGHTLSTNRHNKLMREFGEALEEA